MEFQAQPLHITTILHLEGHSKSKKVNAINILRSKNKMC